MKNGIKTIIKAGLVLLLTAPLFAFEIPGILQVDYQGKKAFTDNKGATFLVAEAIDMGGSTPGLGVDLTIAEVMSNVGNKLNEKQPDAIHKTPLQGIYELYYGKQVLYVDGTGRFIFSNGKLVSASGSNLTSSAQSSAAKLQGSKNLAKLSHIAENEMLVYPASGERSAITIFTDVDCPFCRRIHKDLDTYTKAGITVKYLFYPRAGRQSTAYSTFESVWCSDDPYSALGKAEAGQHISMMQCTNPVEKHLAAAESFGLMGTPAIVLEDGTLMVGYKPAATLIKLALEHRKTP